MARVVTAAVLAVVAGVVSVVAAELIAAESGSAAVRGLVVGVGAEAHSRIIVDSSHAGRLLLLDRVGTRQKTVSHVARTGGGVQAAGAQLAVAAAVAVRSAHRAVVGDGDDAAAAAAVGVGVVAAAAHGRHYARGGPEARALSAVGTTCRRATGAACEVRLGVVAVTAIAAAAQATKPAA